MRKALFAVVLALALPTAAQAQTFAPLDQPAGEYALDPAHASVTWRVMHGGLSRYVGRFSAIEATLDFNPEDPARSSLSVRIPAASVDTGHRNDAGEAAFDRTIANRVFGAEDHPDITFVSTAIERTGEATGLVTGDLTLNGVTRPVTLNVTFNGGRFVLITGKQTLGFSAAATIRRSEFDADDWSQVVGDDVEILIEAEFQRQ